MENFDPRKKTRLVSIKCTPRSDGHLDWKYRLLPTDQSVVLQDYKPTFTARNSLVNHSFSYPPTETVGQVVLSGEVGAGTPDGMYTEVLRITENNAVDLYHVTVEHSYIIGDPPPTEDTEILDDPRKP